MLKSKQNISFILMMLSILIFIFTGGRMLITLKDHNLERQIYTEIIKDQQNTPIQTNAYKEISKEAFNSEYDFKIIGYRIGKNRSSLILKKDNKEFVLYKGEQLANGLRLIAIRFPDAEFELGGNLFKINLEND